MPVFLLSLLPKILPALKSKWALFAVLGLALFAGGWYIGAKLGESKLNAYRADAGLALAAAVAQSRSDALDRLTAQQSASDAIRDALVTRIDEISILKDTIDAELATAQLVKPEVISCDIPERDKNPFTHRFVELWNAGVRLAP